MANPIDIGLRIAQVLDSIGIKMGSYIGKSSNVKKAMFGGKSTMFKPNALEALRGEGKNFDDALKLIEEEAQFIVNASDAEKIAFLNNVNDYKQFGGPLKKDTKIKEGLDTLESSVTDLQTTAKTMKDDAEAGLASAKEDLKVFLETGGNPLKKKEEKYLGGSMHEEGQLRTAIRTFLKNEFKNGRIKLNKDDQFRIMEYSPMMEDDPIKVFKKIYGDEAYKRAGTFPGAFETGESFNHYESIFRSKMGEDILKVKDKKYVGDGTLTLTNQEEVIEPTKLTDDDDIPFAKGGRARFASGGGKKRIVQEIIEYITTKFTPMDAMKEVNKVIGKTGKYKNLKLTDDNINDIVEGSNDFIFQRDPDNLFVEGSIKERTKYFDDADEAGTFFPKTNKDSSIDEMSVEDSLTTLEGLGATKMAERFKLKQRYPGISEDLLTNIIEDTDPVHRASVLAKMDQAMKLIVGEGKGTDEAIDILKSEPKTKMATGGRIGFKGGTSFKFILDEFFKKFKIKQSGDSVKDFLNKREFMKTIVGNSEKNRNNRMLQDIIEESDKIRKNPEFKFKDVDVEKDIRPIFDKETAESLKKDRKLNATGGRAGYYSGGQAMIEPDLSDVGHGSDALMARTRLTAPGSQATTSTGLNYLLGEDNDNTRIPFNQGNTVLPKSKPAQSPLVELSRIYKTYEDAMPGVSKDTQKYLQQDFIKKLNNAGISQEAFMTYRMQNNFANGGRIGFQDGLNFKKFFNKKTEKLIDKVLEKETEQDINILEEGVKELNKKSLDKYTSIYETRPTRDKFPPGRLGNKEYELALNEYYETEKGKKEQENEMFKMVEEFQTLKKKGIIDRNTPFERFKKMKEQRLVKNKILELDIKYPENEIINKKTGTLNEENLKKTIDQAQVDLEISPIDGLTLKRSLNTEGEQSVTGGSFDINNLNFSSDNIEEGKLTSKGNYTFGGVDLSGMINSNDGEILNTELGFNYDNKTLEGKMKNSDGYRKTEFDLNKNFKLPTETEFGYKTMFTPKNLKLKNVIDNLDFGIKGNYDITSSNGQTYKNSDLTPKINYDDGIFNASIAKEILEGGDGLNLGAGVNYNNFYLKGDNLLSPDRTGVAGYQKEFGDKDGNLFFTAGAEKNLFDDEYTGGLGFKYKYADGGIAGLRQNYGGGGGVNLARRGFLKVLGGTVAAVAAFKTGALKLLGKTATTKAAPKLFTAAEGSGAPAWFEGMVNKVLADGVDITKKAATMDGQTVKSLDTPTGKVDVTIDRTGNIDVNYMGDNTALGEGVDMRYVVGQADEMTKVKPFDEFEAVENIPEGQMSSPNDYNVEFAENTTDNVKNLYSDTSELAELGGQKPLIKDISESIKKKQTLKKMNENPDEFASDNLRDDFPNYDYGDVDPN